MIPEENEIVQEALRRLSPQEKAKRTFRIRRALNLNMKKAYLPESEQITAQTVFIANQDVPYLTPLIKQIEAEIMTRHEYDNMVSVPKALLARNTCS